MALLLSSVFGVTGCGSDDDVAVESRVKNVAPWEAALAGEASGATDSLSKADCDLLDFDDLIDLIDRLDRLDRRLELRDEIRDLLDVRDLLNRLDLRELYDSCAAASDSPPRPGLAEGDDVDRG